MAYLKLNYVELVTLLRKICSPHTITGTCVTPVQKMSLQITLYLSYLLLLHDINQTQWLHPTIYKCTTHKKVINSSTKCLTSVKIAIFTPHIIPPSLVNVWLIFNLQKHLNIFKDSYWFEKWEFIACSNRQFEPVWAYRLQFFRVWPHGDRRLYRLGIKVGYGGMDERYAMNKT